MNVKLIDFRFLRQTSFLCMEELLLQILIFVKNFA